MSNLERQRRFRERHPGYYAKLKAARRAGLQEMVDLSRAVLEEQARHPSKAEGDRQAAQSVAIESGMI